MLDVKKVYSKTAEGYGLIAEVAHFYNNHKEEINIIVKRIFDYFTSFKETKTSVGELVSEDVVNAHERIYKKY